MQKKSALPLLLAAIFIFPYFSFGQQVDCTVQVNYESVSTTDKEELSNFAADISDYVNNYKWGPENLDEKVKFALNIFVQGTTGENRYQAQVFVGSQRSILGTQKSSVVVRLLDEAWEFTYVKGRPINHNLYTFSDLASFLDFYVYIILGYDYDTYESLSGTPFFQKASDIASLGRSSGSKGWQLATASYSRAQLTDEILSPKFEPVRKASYVYHFKGLDSLTSKPARAYGNILSALETIAATRNQADPRNILIKAFFEAKHMEIAELFVGYPDDAIYLKLGSIDPAHIKTYEEYRTKRKF